MRNPIVFLIDDDEDDRCNFVDALKNVESNAAVIFAEDGVHALELINTPSFISPSLIFLDLNMPRMNGLELLSKLRQNNHFAGVPIIMYSTSSDSKTVTDCLQLGADDFFEKPVSFNVLVGQLQSILSRYLTVETNSTILVTSNC